MQKEKLYRIARKRHGAIGQDVVHDLVVKFGEHTPSDAYLTKCVKNAKPEPIQQAFEFDMLQEDEVGQELFIDEDVELIMSIIESLRDKYEMEVDTFLECKVNGTMKSFQQHSGVSRSTLEKICNFVKQEILNAYEYHRYINS